MFESEPKEFHILCLLYHFFLISNLLLIHVSGRPILFLCNNTDFVWINTVYLLIN